MSDKTMTRPAFPKRAVITGGMPYGEKALHFGHVGGVFIHADIFARFLRDRIGPENVLFVSGTDCYGAGVMLGYEKAQADGFNGSITDFVTRNHEAQKETLSRYHVSLNLYGGSAIGEAGRVHDALSAEIFLRLHQNGALKLEETMQFYDADKGVFLNGRQVTGRCPIQGCKSENAYADECSLGHHALTQEDSQASRPSQGRRENDEPARDVTQPPAAPKGDHRGRADLIACQQRHHRHGRAHRGAAHDSEKHDADLAQPFHLDSGAREPLQDHHGKDRSAKIASRFG